jgi:uncharacterized membrane protein YagU involved in acid resistance
MNTSTNIMKAALWGGLIAATADMGYALIHYHFAADIAFLRIPQSIAAGLLGRDASFAGGVPTALLGTVLHYFILIVASGIYATVSLKWRALVTHPWACGIAFGIAVFAFMRFVVLPLSAIGAPHLPKGQFLVGELLSHLFGVGVPIAFMARRYCEPSAPERAALATPVG